MIHAEITQDALVELETELPWVTVIHPLPLGVLHVLPSILVFQFKGKNRDTVDGQHHVHGFLRIGGVVPLAAALDLVTGISPGGGFVEAGFRHEVADVEGDTPMLEPVAEDGEESVRIAGGVECQAELPHRIDLVLLFKACPLFGLGGLDEANQGVDVQGQRRVVSIGALDIAAGGERRADSMSDSKRFSVVSIIPYHTFLGINSLSVSGNN